MIKRLFFLALLGVAGAWAFREYVLEGVWVASASMEPTLPVGAHYFVNKVIYRTRMPTRGEIIVFQNPLNDKTGMIKRVIAVGGDVVARRSKQIYLNNLMLSEPYAVYRRSQERLIGDNFDPVKVPENHVFVLGDNRDESEDSSVWTDPKTGEAIRFISRKKIQGRLVLL